MPLLILHGDDDFAIAERVTQLKNKMGDPSMASLNISELNGKNVPLAELRGVCDAMPFLGDKRLILVNGLLTRLTGKSEEGEETESASASDYTDGLIAYFDLLPDTTQLVFTESKPINPASRLLKAAVKIKAAIIKCDVPQGAAMSQWIVKRAKASGGDFKGDAAEALATAIGDEPRMLANEIDKLLAYVNWARAVEVKDVNQLTPSAGEAIIWDLVDALGARNAQQALNKFHTLLAQPSQDQFAIFNMIVRQFRFILQVREILDHGGTINDVMSKLSQKSFPAEKLMRQARNFTLPQLEDLYHKLLELDLSLKSGGAEDTTAIDTFIATLTTR
ncbi:MAG: DNA polymerase III subunit delta [Chloroflexi bacterium]|nr:DNA polymerase III subunit delta [Chloroflexota bacterium]